MKLVTSNEVLEVHFEKRERFWALKNKLTLKKDSIINIEWFGGVIDRSRLRGLRLPGTSVPGIFHAGSFWRRDGWEFWYVYMNKPGYLVITTTEVKHRVIRLSVSEDAAQPILKWFGKFHEETKE